MGLPPIRVQTRKSRPWLPWLRKGPVRKGPMRKGPVREGPMRKG
eukprot:CAMPEP_0181217852 /NCGR_PEP_ID=MMETSP1096-20121128/27373_1 /TAXON_ID=156174 ORGANISM="Chrysochromulina ericina, Strain CCMP281" /NCGR_SAMPLE_ID=MMETSP1096 /ASSEMBLY_ACC=CAM_ASM_000453 /LENGTH=43 /DNA_ID= /DNA_START= /DNA_END= /DNA_ORIENTATION=